MDDPKKIKAKLRMVAQDHVPEQELYLSVLLQAVDDVCIPADECPEQPQQPKGANGGWVAYSHAKRRWKYAVDRWYERRDIRSDAIRYFMGGGYCTHAELVGINPEYVARLLRQYTDWGKSASIPDSPRRILGLAA